MNNRNAEQTQNVKALWNRTHLLVDSATDFFNKKFCRFD